MTKYFYTSKSCAGTDRFPSGEVKHRKYVAKVCNDKLAEEVSKSLEFVEITEQAYNDILFGGKRFLPEFHLAKKQPPKFEPKTEPKSASETEAAFVPEQEVKEEGKGELPSVTMPSSKKTNIKKNR